MGSPRAGSRRRFRVGIGTFPPLQCGRGDFPAGSRNSRSSRAAVVASRGFSQPDSTRIQDFTFFWGGFFANQNPKIPPFSQRKIPPSRSEELGAAASDLQHHPRTWKILTQPQKFHVFPQEFPAFPPNYTRHRHRVGIPRFWVLFPVFISINYRRLPARWGRAQAGIPGNAGPGLPNPHV